jgi:hypothetical protein
LPLMSSRRPALAAGCDSVPISPSEAKAMTVTV